jgi:hypothetical protein
MHLLSSVKYLQNIGHKSVAQYDGPILEDYGPDATASCTRQERSRYPFQKSPLYCNRLRLRSTFRWVVAIGLLQILFCTGALSSSSRAGVPELPPGSYVNPLGDPPIHLQDPYVLVHARKYYLFGTASPSEGFQCYESSDLAHWKLVGWAWRKTPMRAAQGDLHAPQVVLYQGMFCLVYSARMVGGTRFGLAASTHPEGPYHDVHVPWLSLSNSCTAGDVFIDDNGKAYLTFGQRTTRDGCAISEIFGVALNKDLTKIVGEPVKLLEPAQRWELARRDQVRYNEAPRMFKISGRYYLSYSANDPLSPDCAIGYARADKPLGPWTKAAENPLLSSRPDQGVVGLGQGSTFRSLDTGDRFLVYSAIADPENPSGYRTVNMDRLVLEDGRKLTVLGPSRSPQRLPTIIK